MKVVLFCHSLVSDWNHGTAHFLRGVVRELMALGHRVDVWEPRDAWSRSSLLSAEGRRALEPFHRAYPRLASWTYKPGRIDLDAALATADLVLVHEWTSPELVARLGEHRRRWGGYRLLLHDTRYRAVTAPEEIEELELDGFDGVLAFGDALRDLWLARGWTQAAWTWHEAVDHRLFHPIESERVRGDLVWIGDWGEGERAGELEEFLIEPVRRLGLRARVYGEGFPPAARERLASAGIDYGGWLADPRVPREFARHRLTLHLPNRALSRALPGIPTIRAFEAIACGIPLLSSPWQDADGLFEPGDMLMAEDGDEMTAALHDVLAAPQGARSHAARARARLLERHTCHARALELVELARELGADGARLPAWTCGRTR